MAKKSTTGGETMASPVDRLSVAIKEGNSEEFLRLLRTEVRNLHGTLDTHGLNPLHVAVEAGRHKMVCTLLHHQKYLRLDVNIRSQNPRKMGWTPFHFAVHSKNMRVAKMLLKHGCDAHSLVEAATTGSLRSWEQQCKGSLTSWGKQSKLDDFVRIQELAFPNFAPSHLENPQSLTAQDIGNLLPNTRPGLLIEALLHLEAIIPYQPLGSYDVRYCFPSHFPRALPSEAWQDPHKYMINVGRYLSPIARHNVNLLEVLYQLLPRILADIGECQCVSQHGFCFKTKHTECKVECCGDEGIMVLVRTNESLHNIVPHCCDILSYTTGAIQELANGCLSCHVVSSHDLQEERSSPHIYSASEVEHARVTQQHVLFHPSGVKEYFLNLMLERIPSEGTPTKHDVSLLQLTHPIGGYTPPCQKQHVTRRLQYPITDYYWPWSVCEAAVHQCYKDLTQYMKPQLLIPPLVEARYLTLEDASSVITLNSPLNQSVHLLGLLQRNLKGAKDYHNFFRILLEEEEHQPHREIAESLFRACEEIASSDQEESFTEQTWMHYSPATPLFSSSYRGSRGNYYGTSGSYSNYGERTPSTAADSGIHTQSNSNSRNQYHSSPKTTGFGKTKLFNTSAANFADSSSKQTVAISPLTVKVPGKESAEVKNPQHATPPKPTPIHHQQPLPTGDDDFEMKELFHPTTCPLHPPPDLIEEGDPLQETSPKSKNSSKPIAVPTFQSSSSSSAHNTHKSPAVVVDSTVVPSSRRSSDQSDSSTGSSSDSRASSFWSLEAPSESPPKDLSCYEESWKSKAKTAMKDLIYNVFFPKETTTSERPKYILGLGIRM